jgi:hypothetical protein
LPSSRGALVSEISSSNAFASVVIFMPVSVILIQFFFLWKASHKKKNWLSFGDADAGERGAIA